MATAAGIRIFTPAAGIAGGTLDTVIGALHSQESDVQLSKYIHQLDMVVCATVCLLSGTKFVTPCTLTQIVVIRPVLLQRLMSKKRIKVNQRQAGYNATLLHITVLLYMNPPQLMLKVLQPDKAGSTAKDRSMIQKRWDGIRQAADDKKS